MRPYFRFVLGVAALFVASCGESGSRYAAVPDGDPKAARQTDLRGLKHHADVIIGADGAIYWAQQVTSGYQRIDTRTALGQVADLPAPTCRFPKPDEGDLVRHVIIERGIQNAPIYHLSRRDVGDRAANFVKYLAASQGRNRKVWNYEESDVMRVANVVVTETAYPVYLVLSSETNVLWNILPAAGAKISKIALISSGATGLANAPEGVTVSVVAGEKINNCRMPPPMRMPQDNWRFVRNAEADGSRHFRETLARDKKRASDYDRWIRDMFGASSKTSAVAEMGLSNVLIGPAPEGEDARVEYRAVGEGAILASPADYRIIATPTAYREAHDLIVKDAAQKAAGGDLEAIANATKS